MQYMQQQQLQLQLQQIDEGRGRRRSPFDESHGSEGGKRRSSGGDDRRRQIQPLRNPPPIKIPKFKGEHDANAYMEWEQKLDQIFSIYRVNE